MISKRKMIDLANLQEHQRFLQNGRSSKSVACMSEKALNDSAMLSELYRPKIDKSYRIKKIGAEQLSHRAVSLDHHHTIQSCTARQKEKNFIIQRKYSNITKGTNKKCAKPQLPVVADRMQRFVGNSRKNHFRLGDCLQTEAIGTNTNPLRDEIFQQPFRLSRRFTMGRPTQNWEMNASQLRHTHPSCRHKQHLLHET